MSFEVYLHNKAHKFLKNLDRRTYDGIMNKITDPSRDPFPSDAKRVVGRKEKVFRIRFSKYRILYLVYLESNT